MATNTIDGRVFVVSGRTCAYHSAVLKARSFRPVFRNDYLGTFFGKAVLLISENDKFSHDASCCMDERSRFSTQRMDVLGLLLASTPNFSANVSDGHEQASILPHAVCALTKFGGSCGGVSTRYTSHRSSILLCSTTANYPIYDLKISDDLPQKKALWEKAASRNSISHTQSLTAGPTLASGSKFPFEHFLRLRVLYMREPNVKTLAKSPGFPMVRLKELEKPLRKIGMAPL